MIVDRQYEPKNGRLSDVDISWLCSGDKPMISPFLGSQAGKPSFGLSSCGYDLRLGKNYCVQNKDAGNMIVDPISKEDQEMAWIKKTAIGDEIIIEPGECILTETVETIDMPDDVVAIVLGKSTFARNNLLVNATPLEPGWRGIITLELHNTSHVNSVKLHVGQGIAQGLFERMANPPARTYSNRESGGVYQDQKGATTSR